MNEVPFTELFSAYLDGELTADEQAGVEHLLATDPAARQLLDEMRALGATLQTLPQHQVDEDLSQRVLDLAARRMLIGGTAESREGVSGTDKLSVAKTQGNVDAELKPLWKELSWRGMLSRRALVWSGVAVALAIFFRVTEQPPKPAMRTVATVTHIDHAAKAPTGEMQHEIMAKAKDGTIAITPEKPRSPNTHGSPDMHGSPDTLDRPEKQQGLEISSADAPAQSPTQPSDAVASERVQEQLGISRSVQGQGAQMRSVQQPVVRRAAGGRSANDVDKFAKNDAPAWAERPATPAPSDAPMPAVASSATVPASASGKLAAKRAMDDQVAMADKSAEGKLDTTRKSKGAAEIEEESANKANKVALRDGKYSEAGRSLATDSAKTIATPAEIAKSPAESLAADLPPAPTAPAMSPITKPAVNLALNAAPDASGANIASAVSGTNNLVVRLDISRQAASEKVFERLLEQTGLAKQSYDGDRNQSQNRSANFSVQDNNNFGGLAIGGGSLAPAPAAAASRGLSNDSIGGGKVANGNSANNSSSNGAHAQLNSQSISPLKPITQSPITQSPVMQNALTQNGATNLPNANQAGNSNWYLNAIANAGPGQAPAPQVVEVDATADQVAGLRKALLVNHNDFLCVTCSEKEAAKETPVASQSVGNVAVAATKAVGAASAPNNAQAASNLTHVVFELRVVDPGNATLGNGALGNGALGNGALGNGASPQANYTGGSTLLSPSSADSLKPSGSGVLTLGGSTTYQIVPGEAAPTALAPAAPTAPISPSKP